MVDDPQSVVIGTTAGTASRLPGVPGPAGDAFHAGTASRLPGDGFPVAREYIKFTKKGLLMIPAMLCPEENLKRSKKI
ncbi:hypothetical protein vBValSR12Z_89 [Vibrio phage vB_ValS_R12Z]